jgi:cytochrome c5
MSENTGGKNVLKLSPKFVLFMVVITALALVIPAAAQDTPSVEVSDQVVLHGAVLINSTYSEGPGFMVIHADGGGAPGPVIGYRAINAGWNYSYEVPIDAANATPVLYAMLHTDTGAAGVYEFGTVEGADGPVVVDGAPVTPAFNVSVLNAADQAFDGSLRVASVTVAQPSWVVIHSGDASSPGPVLGQTLVNAGTTANVLVTLSGDVTPILWPMLHVDDNTAGTYEFGTVEGADAPIAVGDQVATLPIWTVPHMVVEDQIVLHGDGAAMGDAAPTLVAKSVLSAGPGFLVVHADVNGGPGEVAGFVAVPDGLSTNVTVELDAAKLTPVLWPMLHVDTGAVGTYEFGTVEGADGPVVVDGNPVTFAINAAPSLRMEAQTLSENEIYIDSALIDAPGWIAVHSSQDGAPGPVIGTFPLLAGLNTNVEIEVDPAQAGEQVFPMLHYDTGEMGVYEFGTVEGADGPVVVGGNVVVAPLSLTGATAEEPTPEHEMGATEEAGGDTGMLDGNALVDERCTVCHSRERIDQAVKDEAGWTETVDRMIGHGAQLSDEERAAVIQYLVETHGDTGGGDMVLDGDALVSERCTVCHSRERIDNADKDEAGWTETVDRMIGHGAQLSDAEREAVIQYLVETH